MTDSSISQVQLEHLARQHAVAVVEAGDVDGRGAELHKVLLEKFRDTWQPSLSDKAYTALYRTYTDWVMAAISNHYRPGSVVAGPFISPSSIPDGFEIVRANAEPMSAERWDMLAKQAVSIAKKSAEKVAEISKTGGDGRSEMSTQLDIFLRASAAYKPNEDESIKVLEIYHSALNAALKSEVDKIGSQSSESYSSKSGCLGVIALFAIVPFYSFYVWIFS